MAKKKEPITVSDRTEQDMFYNPVSIDEIISKSNELQSLIDTAITNRGMYCFSLQYIGEKKANELEVSITSLARLLYCFVKLSSLLHEVIYPTDTRN